VASAKARKLPAALSALIAAIDEAKTAIAELLRAR
jgi:hypothetical protein